MSRFAFISFVFITTLINCTYETAEPVFECSESDLTLQVLNFTETNCGQNDGSVELEVMGGTAPYQYQILNGNTQSGNSFLGLAAGNYTFKVVDSKKCEQSVSIDINNIDGVTISSIDQENTTCGKTTGSITINAELGKKPYEYKISDAEYQSSNVVSNLSNGEHTVFVKDANDCEFSETVLISTGISYKDTIESIISMNCTISGCHNGSIFPDFRTFATIQSRAASIKLKTGNRTMPQGRTLTQNQIDQIACWVDDGAPNN